MISAERITLLSFLLTFREHRSVYADICAKEAAENGVLLAAETDGEPSGYICAAYDTDTLLVTYAYTLPQYRGQGVLSELLKTLSGMFADIPLRLSVKSGHEFSAAFRAACEKNRFDLTDTVMTYSCDCKADGEERWAEFMRKKGGRLCNTLERQGSTALPFCECSRELLAQIYHSCSTDYGNTLDPRPFFDVKAKNMLYDLSFAAVRDGRLAAYVLAVGAGSGAVIFEQISASKKETGSGVILLPFCRSVDMFFKTGRGVASYAMYDSNRQAGAFRKSVLNIFDTRVSAVLNYCRRPGSDREK